MLRFCLFLCFCIFGFWLIPSNAQACMGGYVPDESFNIADAVQESSTILIGNIASISSTGYDSIIIAIEVETYLKGEGRAFVEISIECWTYTEPGNSYIFFIASSWEAIYFIEFLGFNTEPILPATEAKIREVQDITGRSIPPTDLTFMLQLSRFITKYAQWFGGLSLSVLLLGASLALLQRKSLRKPKMKRGIED